MNHHCVFNAQWIRIRNPLHDTTMFTTRRPNVNLRVPWELFASKIQPPDINARTGRSGQWRDHEWPFCANNSSAWSILSCLKMFDVRRWSLIFGIRVLESRSRRKRLIVIERKLYRSCRFVSWNIICKMKWKMVECLADAWLVLYNAI